MGPKEKWEYAGDADTTQWHDWKEHKLEDKSSEFSYRDGDNIGNKSDDFPEVGDQKNPEKM